ncbi:MAG: NusG domain II-containing protein [Firmicutes bacterium]|nr:NusG domain II-containing protein [Bacillota bacterium]
MNKNDFKLILVILVLIIVLFIIFYNKKEKAYFANVYYKSDIILQIDLNIDKIYEVNGDNGIVKIEVLDKKIRVIEETSNYNICAKQGFISNKGEVITCLPNKIIIELPSDDIDVEVK